MSRNILDLLGEVANRAQARLRSLPVLEELGLSHFQARTLAMIGREPGSTQQELTATMGTDKAQMARTIRELDDRGLITRRAHESDWRSRRIHLNSDGERVYAALDAQRAAMGEDFLRDLSPEERQLLQQALTRMRARLVSGS